MAPTANLVLLPPYRLEGQGPEHSSARIERLLQLCARDNITIVHPSTPADYFLCSGKIAYELEKERQAGGAPIEVIRLERLYPFPVDALTYAVEASGAKEALWLQEEPENYGSGLWLAAKLRDVAARTGVGMLPMVARAESASPAGSFHEWHDREQHAPAAPGAGVG